MNESDTTPIFDESAASRYLHLSPSTLRAWRNQGRGPNWVRAGRRVLYRREDIDRYLAENLAVESLEPCEHHRKINRELRRAARLDALDRGEE
jgi:hypothetical protein